MPGLMHKECERVGVGGQSGRERCGSEGRLVTELIDAYSFDVSHTASKTFLNPLDPFIFGISSPSLLLWFGNLSATRAGWTKAVDAWRKVLARVEAGAATAESYSFELVCGALFSFPTLAVLGSF